MARPFPSFLIFKGEDGQFYWHYQRSNHKSIAASGEGYHSLADCDAAIEMMQQCRDAEIWEDEKVAAHRKSGGR